MDRAATHGLRGGEKGKGETWRGDFEERMLMSTCCGESRPEVEVEVDRSAKAKRVGCVSSHWRQKPEFDKERR